MEKGPFRTPAGTDVPAVTADEMREIDRIAVDEIGLGILQMMENAGRTLAAHSHRLRDGGSVVIVCGAGGNGGGGFACARHLSNHDVPVTVILDRDPAALTGPPATQYQILQATDVSTTIEADSLDSADLLVDALIGYGLRDALRGAAAKLIEEVATMSAPILSLDVPSGYDATTGETPGVALHPDRTVTLALPKTGLRAVPGDLYLADIGIPAGVYRRLDLQYSTPFSEEYSIRLLV